jgi:hypothetical protein
MMAIRLRVRELAEARGLNLARFQREAQLPVATARRFFYGTSDGSVDGPPLKHISLEVLDQIARYFDVPPGDLLVQVHG